MVEIAASILSADFARLGEEVREAVAGGASVIHLDVMDGHFVPNIAIGPAVVVSVRKITKVPLDCHLMVERPGELIPAFAEAGADWISVHQEACVHLDRTLRLIASHGCKPGVVINPATPIATLEEVLPFVHHVLVMSVNPGFGGQTFIHSCLRKIERLKNIRESYGLGFRIEIDGGVHQETLESIVHAGAEILVVGSAIFGQGRPKQSTQLLLELALNASSQAPRPAVKAAPNA